MDTAKLERKQQREYMLIILLSTECNTSLSGAHGPFCFQVLLLMADGGWCGGADPQWQLAVEGS